MVNTMEIAFLEPALLLSRIIVALPQGIFLNVKTKDVDIVNKNVDI